MYSPTFMASIYKRTTVGRPKTPTLFREYLQSRSEDLKRYNVETLDQLLVSPRDGQPLIIVTSQRRVPFGAPGMPWAAYEQTGVDGKRIAVQVRGGAHELTAEEIAKLEAPPPKR